MVESVEAEGVRVKSVRRAGSEDVYCLSAVGNGNMIANGVVVKNCDSLRYAIFTHWGEKKTLKEKTQEERQLEAFSRMSAQEKMAQTWGPGWQKY